MKLLITWLASALAILLSAWLVPGAYISGLGAALIAAVVLGAVNAVIRPILIILTLPINILTLGLFTLVINTLMISLTASLLSGFSVANFWVSFLFAIILTLITEIIESLVKEKNVKFPNN